MLSQASPLLSILGKHSSSLSISTVGVPGSALRCWEDSRDKDLALRHACSGGKRINTNKMWNRQESSEF